MKFGLYDGGKSCYFEDGTRVDYQQLWDALRAMYNLGKAHSKTLYDLCPNTYMGVFSHKFHKFMWTKKILNLISNAHSHSN